MSDRGAPKPRDTSDGSGELDWWSKAYLLCTALSTAARIVIAISFAWFVFAHVPDLLELGWSMDEGARLLADRLAEVQL